MKMPDVDLSDCLRCAGWVEMCPLVFKLNELDYVEIVDLAEYPEKLIN